jgi:hypothetical protein
VLASQERKTSQQQQTYNPLHQPFIYLEKWIQSNG